MGLQIQLHASLADCVYCRGILASLSFAREELSHSGVSLGVWTPVIERCSLNTVQIEDC